MSFIASPSTRSYAGDKGVDLAALARATGRETLAREDVDRHLAGTATGPKPAAGDASRFWQVDHAAHGAVREEPVSRIGRVAAENLAAANALIPQVTHHDRADLRAIEAFRTRQRPAADRRGIRLTSLAFHVMALTRCLQAFPRFNASLSADGTTLILKRYVHVGIAVDTDHGLMVPVIRNADRMGLWQIAEAVSALAARAKDRRLRAEEMGGASMTISNLGGIGGIGFTPIVNPPEVAILGLTRSETVPYWDGEAWVPVPMVPLDLSYDHRVINGADAARFLRHYARLLEDPRRLLL